MYGGQDMTVTVEIEGMEDLHKQLSNLVNLAKEKRITQNVAMFAIKEMYDEIRDNAPIAEESYFRYYRGSQRARRKGNAQNSRRLVQPGTLRRSIARKRVKLEKSVGVGIYVKLAAFYWRFMEYGTPNMVAKPIFRPSFDTKKEIAVSRFRVRYKKYIDQIIKKQGVSVNAGD